MSLTESVKHSHDQQHKNVAHNPFNGPTIQKVILTTQSQAEIWIACKLGGDDANRAYNESVSLVLKGELNFSAVDTAIQKLVQRHESLRSIFSADGRFMSVLEFKPVHIEHHDFSKQTPPQIEQSVKEYVVGDANYVFDLKNGPLFKVGLLKINDIEHHLVITAHHIVCDGWSLGIILEEIGALYSESVTGKPHSLPKVDDFSEYADELQSNTDSETQEKTEKFWINEYKDSIPVLNLPTDFPRPELRTNKSERQDFSIDKDLLAKLKKVGLTSGASFVTTLMVAFEIFLSKQTGQNDIVIGLPAAGQSVTGKTQLVGHCVNLLPLRSKIDGNQSFSNYLRHRKSLIFDAYDHQQLSFGELLQKLKIQRDPSRVPLVPIVFNIDMGMTASVDFKDLDYKLISNPRTYETFEVFLNATGSQDDFILEWSYNSSLFKEATIKQMMVSFENIIKKIVDDSNIKISDIIEIDNSAYTLLNDTKSYYPEEHLSDLLSQQALKYSNKTALKFLDTQITYGELEQKVNQLSNQLSDKGVISGDFVGVCLPRSIELIIILRAIMQCGAAYVPLDPSYPVQRLDYMIEDSEAKFLITTNELSKTLNSKANLLVKDNLFSCLDEFSDQPISVEKNNSDVAYLLYTSGSTGKPKGVGITHKNIVNLLYSVLENPGVKETDTLISITTISFDIAMVELYAPLLIGAKLIITNEETSKDTRLLLDVMIKEKVTLMQATPTTWQMLLDSGWKSHLPIRAFSTGEALPLSLAKNILNLVDDLWNLYGPTETTIWSAITKVEKTDELIPIGLPVANTQLYIVDENNNMVAPGKIGELCIAGDGVAKGYWKKEDLTKEKFVDNHFDSNSNSKLYRTGDLAKLLPDGNVQCLGRIDHQIKIRGQRIELGEIEQALDGLQGVQSSVVLLNGDLLVANLITSEKEKNANQIEQWKTSLKQQLPAHMIPQLFNLVGEFPKTLNGKIDRKALLVSSTTNNIKTSFAEPSTESEKIIQSIWEECLGLDNIDVNSDFFEIGGHSLVGVKVMAKLEKETGNRVPLVALLKHSTIKKLAAFMDSEFFTWDSLVPLKPEGSKPPLYIVHGANHHVLIFNELAQQLDKEQPVYGLQSRGLNGLTEPHDSIHEMAADYIEEILASNPEGPYALAGFSYGGIVAYEMARQLKAKGKEVTILAQFDTYVFPEYYHSSPSKKKVYSIFYLMGKVVYIFLNMFSNKKNFIRRTELIKLQLKGLYLRLKYGKAKQYEMQFNVALKLMTNHNIATSKYTIVPQDIVIDLFRAKEEVNFVHDQKFLGWKKMAEKGIRRHIVPGNHVDMFEKQNATEFARSLQHVLDNYNSQQYE
ncbi:non-ribosomal peptide synthetase [Psychroserpens sp. Hel_I_66]|uniref:non-ribosomal peptide synthetase n=1 Tax=Psychroserpens sp. Hel_I_66 TaxID=1250004 RepID=UPI00064746D4|nr:non-ribosomal peptide synthetase [Psychroserpens sp. Hel_I_66]